MQPVKWIGIILLCLFVSGSLSSLPAVDEQRQAYDRMVEESTREADEYLKEKENKMQATEAEAQSKQDATLAERIQAEQKRIAAEMDTVRGRGLGPTFTQGMKNNLLQQLQDKLTQLMSNPQAYFGEQ